MVATLSGLNVMSYTAWCFLAEGLKSASCFPILFSVYSFSVELTFNK